ncbi:MAG: hypothetical protein LBK99_09835, partial [Opitutaceae bacterium]|nr:hypothetical protein [Opitutaceae bacterium]
MQTVETGEVFLWPDERIDAEFDRRRIYPLKPESEKIANDVLKLYAGWLDFFGISQASFSCAANRLPWVPVGAVGPVLVLGHSEPDSIPPASPASPALPPLSPLSPLPPP